MKCYQVGSSDKVTFDSTAKNNIVTAWKLDSDDTETIAEDDLLEADDLKKPDSSALKGRIMTILRLWHLKSNFF